MESKFPFPLNYLINNTLNDKHTTLILYGRRGAGKSRTALFLAYNILYYRRHVKLPENKEDFNDLDMWDKIIRKYIVFTPKQLVNRLKNTRRVKSVLVIDDANIMFNSELYRENSKLYFKLIGLFATIRTKVSNLIITCVDPDELIKPIRQMQSWFGYVSSDRFQTYVKVYELHTTPVRKYYKNVGEFIWKNDYLPNKAYKEYEKIRWFVGEMALRKVEETLKQEKSKAKDQTREEEK